MMPSEVCEDMMEPATKQEIKAALKRIESLPKRIKKQIDDELQGTPHD